VKTRSFPSVVGRNRLKVSDGGRKSKRVADSGFHTLDSGFRRLDSGFHAYGLRIPSFLRFRIPKFLTLVFIRSSEANILHFEYDCRQSKRDFHLLSKRSTICLFNTGHDSGHLQDFFFLILAPSLEVFKRCQNHSLDTLKLFLRTNTCDFKR